MTDGITRIRSKLGCPLWVKSRHVQHKRLCPLYPPKADMCGATRYVRFVPIADIRVQGSLTASISALAPNPSVLTNDTW